MLFDTVEFWLFFAIALVVMAALPNRPAKLALVLFSYVFYAFWDVRFIALLAGSTIANYLFGLLIESANERSRKRALILSIVFNLALLAFFKYYNFFIASFAAVTGISPDNLLLRITLPVGISFITFEGIAYAMDVYRRHIPAVRKPVDFAVFISFFPHLVAGPIIRPADFFPQLHQRAVVGESDARWGLREILKGLLKKVVLADFFGPIADAYFGGSQYQGADVAAWVGVLAFSFQIYFDFSGYTDIARGCACLLGYRFPPNFERPYLSQNITEFWRRWHISLSSWLRDYLYVPLGGNRKGEFRTYVNLIIVMGLGGLWHGASWNFAIWGLYHGALLSLNRYWRKVVESRGWGDVADHSLLSPLWILVTFLLVTIGWIPFRAPTLEASVETFRSMLLGPLPRLSDAPDGFLVAIAACAIWCFVDGNRRIQNWLSEASPRWISVSAVVLAAVVLQVYGQFGVEVPFIYFQF